MTARAENRQSQLRLPLGAPARTRRWRAEDLELHAAVVALRLAGHQVYRAGRGHATIDGKRVTNDRLCEIANLGAIG